MKPIEEGCKAVIVGASFQENNGKILRIGKFIGDLPQDEEERTYEPNRWEVDKAIIGEKGFIYFHISEKYLQRIQDDGEETTTWQHVAESIGFVPKIKETV